MLFYDFFATSRFYSERLFVEISDIGIIWYQGSQKLQKVRLENNGFSSLVSCHTTNKNSDGKYLVYMMQRNVAEIVSPSFSLLTLKKILKNACLQISPKVLLNYRSRPDILDAILDDIANYVINCWLFVIKQLNTLIWKEKKSYLTAFRIHKKWLLRNYYCKWVVHTAFHRIMQVWKYNFVYSLLP